MADKDLPPDLQDTSTPVDATGDYYNVFISDLDPQTPYKIQFRWQNEDGTYGEDWSPVFNVITDDETVLNPPKFILSDLEVLQGVLKVSWSGLDNEGNAYLKNFDRVDIYVKDNSIVGSDFQLKGNLKATGIFSIPVKPGSYSVKLQALTQLGNKSGFSTTQTVTAKQSPPSNPYDVSASWSGSNLEISFKHDVSNTQNQYLKDFQVYLNDGIDESIFTVTPVVGLTQYKFVLDTATNRKYFGTAFSFTGSVWAQDNASPSNISEKIPFSSGAFVSPLAPPTITVSEGVNGYSVKYTDQLSAAAQNSFLSIEIFESLTDPVTTTPTWISKGTSSANPVIVSTGLSVAKRWVRALVYDSLGNYPKVNPPTNNNPLYSNVASVTPLSIGDGDTEPPACVDDFTIGAATWDSIPITITTTDITTKGFKVAYQETNATLPANVVWNSPTAFDVFEIGAFSEDPSESITSSVIKNLKPGKKYAIRIYPYDSNNSVNIGSCDTTKIATTANATVPAPSTLVFETIPYGVNVRWTEPTTSDTLIDHYEVAISATGFTTKTINTYSNTATFLQLSAGKTYTVTVKTIDTYKIESSTVSGTFSLNADGVSPDGLKPPAVSNLVVRPAFKSLILRWDSVSNKDYTTYDVHMSTVDDFTPNDTTTLLANVDGNFYVVNKLKSGADLDLNTRYYISIVSRDADGTITSELMYGSGIPSKVNNGDINTGAITANTIEAGAISASTIDASSLLAGNKLVVGSKVSNITSAIVSGGNIVYTANSHSFLVSDLVNIVGVYLIDGISASAFNNPWPATGKQITAVSANTFTIANTTSATGSAYFGRASVVRSDAIAIDSSSSINKLYSGTGVFKGTTTPFYLDTTGKFSILDRLWYRTDNTSIGVEDGDRLTIKGDINATGGTFESYVNINNTGVTSDVMKLGRDVHTDSITGIKSSGIKINNANYWYTDGRLSVGKSNLAGDFNGVSWDGVDKFIVTGKIQANGGYFKGNISIEDTASIYAGTTVPNSETNDVDTTKKRLIINQEGIKSYPDNPQGEVADPTTQILSAPDGEDGFTFLTTAASIGGWKVDTSSIKKSANGTLDINSDNMHITIANASGSLNTTISKPFTSGSSDYVFWAGAESNAAAKVQLAPFTITSEGKLTARNAQILGNVKAGLIATDKYKIQIGEFLTKYTYANSVQSGTTGQVGLIITPGADKPSDYILGDGTFRLGAGKLTYDGSLLNINAILNVGTTDVLTSGTQIGGQLSLGSGILYRTSVGGITTMNGISFNHATNVSDYINADGSFRLAAGKLSYNSTDGVVIKTDLTSSNVFLGTTKSFSSDYILGIETTLGSVTKPIGSFSLAGGNFTYDGLKFNLKIIGANSTTGGLQLHNGGVRMPGDGDTTYGDQTLVVSRSTGYLTGGRVLYYGGNRYPTDSTAFDDSFLQFASSGDLWFSRKA